MGAPTPSSRYFCLLSAAAKAVRRENRRCFDFASGYVSLSTTTVSDADKTFNHVCLFPLDKFIQSFEEHRTLGQHLEKSALEVTREWWALNRTPESAGHRTPVEKSFVLFRHQWKAGAQTHFGLLQLGLNSWGFTTLWNDSKTPARPQIEDLKVSHLEST